MTNTPEQQRPEEHRSSVDICNTLLGEDWSRNIAQALVDVARRALADIAWITTREHAWGNAERIIISAPEQERVRVRDVVHEFSRGGEWVVHDMQGSLSPYRAAPYLHLMGARHGAVGSMYLFAFPLERFTQIIRCVFYGETRATAKLLMAVHHNNEQRVEEILSCTRSCSVKIVHPHPEGNMTSSLPLQWR